MTDPNVCYDKPFKEQKHPHFEHRTNKLYRKNNEFSEKKFQRVRRVLNKKKLIHSFQHIGKCLNNSTTSDIPIENLDKVCFILMNNFEHDKHDPQIGPMNDGYLISLNHHRLGFKIFYLYNCSSNQYQQFFEFFLKHTSEHLTVFYSGRNTISSGNAGIEFKDSIISCSEFGKLTTENYNGKCKTVFISESTCGGSVFAINSASKKSNSPKIISLYAAKNTDPDSKEGRRSHGIFNCYFCMILSECPNITLERLEERMNSSLKRFNSKFVYEVSNGDLKCQPIFD